MVSDVAETEEGNFIGWQIKTSSTLRMTPCLFYCRWKYRLLKLLHNSIYVWNHKITIDPNPKNRRECGMLYPKVFVGLSIFRQYRDDLHWGAQRALAAKLLSLPHGIK